MLGVYSQMEKISVVIPTHNRSDVLPRAIKSIQTQTYKVDEIIVVSDGSTDDTEEVVSSLMADDPRIHFINYYPGINGNYARNKGIEFASGDIIGFLDDDDEWLPHKVKKQMEVFHSDPSIGLVYSGQNCIFEDLKICYQTKPSWKGDLSHRIFVHNDIGTTSQVMIRSSILKQTGLFDEKLSALQDYDLWIRCCQITKVGFVYEPCINYYNSIGRKQVSGNTDKFLSSMETILEKYKNIIGEFDENYQKEVYAGRKISIAQRNLRNNDGKNARKYLKESWKIRPSKKVILMYIGSFFSYKTILKVRSLFKY